MLPCASRLFWLWADLVIDSQFLISAAIVFLVIDGILGVAYVTWSLVLRLSAHCLPESIHTPVLMSLPTRKSTNPRGKEATTNSNQHTVRFVSVDDGDNAQPKTTTPCQGQRRAQSCRLANTATTLNNHQLPINLGTAVGYQRGGLAAPEGFRHPIALPPRCRN